MPNDSEALSGWRSGMPAMYSPSGCGGGARRNRRQDQSAERQIVCSAPASAALTKRVASRVVGRRIQISVTVDRVDIGSTEHPASSRTPSSSAAGSRNMLARRRAPVLLQLCAPSVPAAGLGGAIAHSGKVAGSCSSRWRQVGQPHRALLLRSGSSQARRRPDGSAAAVRWPSPWRSMAPARTHVDIDSCGPRRRPAQTDLHHDGTPRGFISRTRGGGRRQQAGITRRIPLPVGSATRTALLQCFRSAD